MDSKESFVNRILSGVDVKSDEEINAIKEIEKAGKRKGREIAFIDMVPKRYRHVEFTGNPTLLTSQRSVIYGPYGTGKTYLGYCIAKELYVAGEVSDFAIAREREIYNNLVALRDKPGEYKKLYFEPDLLVIDEFGKNSHSDATASQIFNIIDYRYDWEKRTILICNAGNADELRQVVPEAIQDRFVGSTHLLTGGSRRVAE